MFRFLSVLSLLVVGTLAMGSNCDDAPTCIENLGEECEVGQGQCGCDLVCFDFGYGFGECGEPLANGVGCFAHTDCQSGQCIQGVCGGPDTIQDPPTCDDDCCDPDGCVDVCAPLGVSCTLGCCDGLVCVEGACAEPTRAPTCRAAGTTCGGDESCCPGTFCLAWESPYLTEPEHVCTPLYPTGTFCTEDAQCETGACIDGSCSEPTCGAVDAACDADRPCCDGSYCQEWASAYDPEPHRCTAQVPDGENCWLDEQCLTGNCTGNVCGQQCVPEGGPCEVGVDPCCQGACHDLGYGYGDCGPLLEAGSFCTHAEECQSGTCALNHCG